ncbi:MAG: helix-hairpin-helix domain-containing protein [Planctomycetota bacterium]|nr:helix-hairpin-helix domain-containing protein [Planctomycetota bacterium]
MLNQLTARRFFSRMQSRFRRARPGSVLILVIVLLLLLAILGTSYLSTTHNDRISSIQNQVISQVDLLGQGMESVVSGILIDDLSDNFGDFRNPLPAGGTPPTYNGQYRGQYDGVNGVNPPGPSAGYNFGDIVNDPTRPNQTPPSTFNFYVFDSATSALPFTIFSPATHLPFTCPVSQPWLADRVPTLVATNPFWQNITQSVAAKYPNGPTSIIGDRPFESPDNGSKMQAAPWNALAPYQPISTLYPGFANDGGVMIPTLSTVPPPATPPAISTLPGTTAIAGDADGDGVADSLLTRLHGAYYDGLTWYAGVRIIDDNSAININTAWDRDNDYDNTNKPIKNGWGLFQSSVGLIQLLNPTNFAAEMNAINSYRFNMPGSSSPQAGVASGPGGMLAAEDETGQPAGSAAARADFAYISQGDVFYNQFIRRMGNPGFNGTSNRFQAFPWSDSGVLAYHFGLLNPGSVSSPSVLESVDSQTGANSFTNYGGGKYRSTPYSGYPGATPPDDQQQWYSDNFSFQTPGVPRVSYYGSGVFPARSLVVTHNPVSNYIQPVYDPTFLGEPINAAMLPYGIGTKLPGTQPNYNHFLGRWIAAPAIPYVKDDVVIGADGATYICKSGGGVTDPGTLSPAALQTDPNWRRQPWSNHPVKTNVNTATFGELFRAFWCVMAGNPADSDSPFGPAPVSDDTIYNPNHPRHEFRSVLRDPTTNVGTPGAPVVFPPGSMTQLRAALAAVNTLGLRDQSQNIVSRNISLLARISATTQPVSVTVFSNAPQPFITEVYADGYGAAGPGGAINANGYVAVELYNPYQADLNLQNYQIALIDRSPGKYTGATPAMPIGSIFTFPAGAPSVIKAGGYMLLENYNYGAVTTTQPSNDATYRPALSGIKPETGTAWQAPAGGDQSMYADVFIPNLSTVLSGNTEMVLLRPRRADGQPSASTDPNNMFDEKNNWIDMVPVDSFDFSGQIPSISTTAPFSAVSYIRSKGGFNCVYGGNYGNGGGNTPPRQGVYVPIKAAGYPYSVTWPPIGGGKPGFGMPVAAKSPPASNPAPPPTIMSGFPPIQVYPAGMPGPNATSALAVNTPAPQKFPFGGFARNGDILDIPFVGAYTVRILPQAAGTILEMNALPMDCGFADAGDPVAGDHQYENIGRFCPMASAAGTTALGGADYYAWAAKVFDYLTVQSTADQSMPNVDAGVTDVTNPANQNVTAYWPGSASASPQPSPVFSGDHYATDHTQQDTVGVEGLININTAPVEVLAMLPLVPSTGGGTNMNNLTLAQAIVAYRNANGPFTSIFDLNKVPGFQTAGGNLAPGSANSNFGLLFPPDGAFPGASGILGTGNDFTAQFASVTRISNLVTIRSDTFTVYIVIEGWQNASYNGGPPTFGPPRLKVVRRFAFIADRSAINQDPTTRVLKTLMFPND